VVGDCGLRCAHRPPYGHKGGHYNELDSWAWCSRLLWTFSRTGPPESPQGREGPAPRACKLDTEVLSYQCSEWEQAARAANLPNSSRERVLVSNAPAEKPTDQLLLVGLMRWHVERCFEDGKTELGFDHWEGRSYLGLKRHQIVTAVSFLILAEIRRELRGEKTGTDRVPSSDCGGRAGGGVRVGGEWGQDTGRARSAVHRSSATGKRQSA
jgi:hypothetical protein